MGECTTASETIHEPRRFLKNIREELPGELAGEVGARKIGACFGRLAAFWSCNRRLVNLADAASAKCKDDG